MNHIYHHAKPLLGITLGLLGAMHFGIPSVSAADSPDPVAAGQASTIPTALVTIHADRPGHVMAGGIGASWHAIREEAKPDSKYKWNLGGGTPQGSALMGNPPLAATAAWQDIERHAA